jgi:hypothetical protein
MNVSGSAALSLSALLVPDFAAGWAALDFEASGGAAGPSARDRLTGAGPTHVNIAIVANAIQRDFLITARLFLKVI